MAGSWRKRRRRVDRALKQASESLAAATEARQEQDTKREREKQTVIAKMDELAKENHLGQLVWNVVTDRGNGT